MNLKNNIENGSMQSDVYLTNQQREFYKYNGYLLIRNLVDTGLLDDCMQRFRDICNDKVDSRYMLKMENIFLKTKHRRGEFLINKIQDFNYDDVLFQYASYKAILNIVEGILGATNVTCFHSMVVSKPPNTEVDSSNYSDIFVCPIRPINSTVGVWTAMEKSNQKNGCLYVVPGSHKTPNSFNSVEGFENLYTLKLALEKGDTVFFHPSLVHGSRPNLTDVIPNTREV
uniref:phytanoyl-CoA dioxygenase n=1 Tax=Photinus pyralis TaxID=7054 RepID=A0A1Y1KTU8_PHOPY